MNFSALSVGAGSVMRTSSGSFDWALTVAAAAGLLGITSSFFFAAASFWILAAYFANSRFSCADSSTHSDAGMEGGRCEP